MASPFHAVGKCVSSDQIEGGGLFEHMGSEPMCSNRLSLYMWTLEEHLPSAWNGEAMTLFRRGCHRQAPASNGYKSMSPPR